MQPLVAVEMWVSYKQTYWLRVANRGAGVARDIRFNFDPVPTNEDGKSFSEIPAFRDGIRILQPGQESLPMIYTFGPRIKELGTVQRFSVTIECKDAGGRRLQWKYDFDLDAYLEFQVPRMTTEEALKEILDQQKIMADALKRIANAQEQQLSGG